MRSNIYQNLRNSPEMYRPLYIILFFNFSPKITFQKDSQIVSTLDLKRESIFLIIWSFLYTIPNLNRIGQSKFQTIVRYQGHLETYYKVASRACPETTAGSAGPRPHLNTSQLTPTLSKPWYTLAARRYYKIFPAETLKQNNSVSRLGVGKTNLYMYTLQERDSPDDSTERSRRWRRSRRTRVGLLLNQLCHRGL